MKRFMMKLANRQGYVLMGAVIVGLAVTSLAIVGAFTSSQNLVAGRNMVQRTRAFYASDGVITMMVQDLIDGNPQKYLLCRWLDSSALIGSATASCTYHHPAPARDSINGNGNGIGLTGTDAGFYFRYTKLSGDIDIKARVMNMTNPSASALCGLMIRDNLAANSKYAMVGLTSNSTAVAFQYRTAAGANSQRQTTATIAPFWLRLVRKGGVYRGYRSTNGVIWSQIGDAQAFSMGDTVRVGIAVTSASGATLCRAVVDSLNLGRGRGADTIGDVIVSYNIAMTADGGYEIIATGSKTDAQGKTIFSMPLKQRFAPAIGTQVVVPDSGWLHYIVYDFRADGSNPEFMSCRPPYHRKVLGRGNAHVPWLVDSFLTADRKPIWRQDYSVERRYRVDRWWQLCPTSTMMWWSHMHGPPHNPPSMERACCARRINEWFRVSGNGGPDMTLQFKQVDPKQPSKWRWFKPDGTELDSVDGEIERAVYGPNYVANYDMANCVAYDSLFFRKEDASFLEVGGGIPSGGKVWGYRRKYSGDQGFAPLDKHPRTGAILRRGFRSERGTKVSHHEYYDRFKDGPCNPPGMKDNADHLQDSEWNRCWTLEIHTQFLYRAGKNTYFAYQDAAGTEVWMYINNRLYDLGDPKWVPPDLDQEVVLLLDSLAAWYQLEDGNHYPLDIFIASRWQGLLSELQIVTDFEMFTPKITRSSWRRDYGRLD